MQFSTTPDIQQEIVTIGSKSFDVKVFVDFDGTISQQDIGDRLFEYYGSIQPYNADFKAGKINIYTYWERVCSTLPKDLEAQEIYEYSQNIEIDPYFKKFTDYLAQYGITPTILSDGFQEYIKPVLDKEGLGYLNYYSNKLQFGNEGVSPIFPYSRDGCSCKSAVCKRALQGMLSKPESIVIYIGDGYSDFCPAESSDIVFAKKNLAKWCNANSIPHYPYKSFFNVIAILKQKFGEGKLKQRNSSKLIRRSLYTSQ